MNFTSLMSFLIALLLASAVQAFKEPPKVQVCNIALCSKCTKLMYYPSKFFTRNQLKYFELQYFQLYSSSKLVYKLQNKIKFQWHLTKFNESVPLYWQGGHAAAECKRILVSFRYSIRLPKNWIQLKLFNIFSWYLGQQSQLALIDKYSVWSSPIRPFNLFSLKLDFQLH